MRQTVLGKSGLKVSAVGFGGIPIQRLSEPDALATILAALDMGVNFIDTAAGYSDSQCKIGMAIQGRREGLVLASKCGDKTREGMLREIDRSRRELGVDCIDLYQLHNSVQDEASWAQVIESVDGALAGLIEAKEKGWIGHIGYTSHSMDMALRLTELDVFETIQFPFNLVTSEPATELIPRCRERNLGFIVMKPLCGGQYDNAELAFKFLNAWPDLVPIPGIETAQEIQQIVEIVESGALLRGGQKVQAEQIARKLGKLFCRRCGYCMPCPQDVPIFFAMTFDSFLTRFSDQMLKNGPAALVAAKAGNCTQCGLCESKCPYKLPIIEGVKKALAQARAVLERP